MRRILIAAVLVMGCESGAGSTGTGPVIPSPETKKCHGLDCGVYGKCTFDTATQTCVVGSDENCRWSQGCTMWGACKRFDSTLCYAKSDEDCLKSTMCTDQDMCWFKSDQSHPGYCAEED